jgi:hypothetical protein
MAITIHVLIYVLELHSVSFEAGSNRGSVAYAVQFGIAGPARTVSALIRLCSPVDRCRLRVLGFRVFARGCQPLVLMYILEGIAIFAMSRNCSRLVAMSEFNTAAYVQQLTQVHFRWEYGFKNNENYMF